MPITVVTKSHQTRKYRLLVAGEPFSGKTFSLASFAVEGVVHTLNCPGEKGTETLPEGEGFYSTYQEWPELDENAGVRETLDRSREARQVFLATLRKTLKQGDAPCHVLAMDGLLKLQEVCLDIVSEGKFFQGAMRGQGLDVRSLYPAANQLFMEVWNEAYYSKVPVVVGTTWVRYDFADTNLSEEEKAKVVSRGGRKLWPNLIGQMGHRIIGEVNASVQCVWESPLRCASCQQLAQRKKEVMKGEHRVWQLNRRGDVEGVGIKDHRGGKFYPDFIHQEWRILKALMEK